MREIGDMRAADVRRQSVTLESLCERWQQSVKPAVKPSTYACYLTMIEKHIQGKLGAVQVSELTNKW